jgi:hypothetical protein
MLYFFLETFYLSSTFFGCYSHPSSGAQLQCTAIGFFYGFGVFYSIVQVLVLGHFDTLARSVTHIHSPMKMEQTHRSETSAIKHHTPGTNPKDYTQHSDHRESFKSRVTDVFSTELEIRLSFVKVSEFQGGGV